MKRIVLATLAAGCTQNADIGHHQPVSCMPNNGSAADAHGTLTSFDGFSEPFIFLSASLQVQPIRVTMTSQTSFGVQTMNIMFLCGQPTLDAYGVVGVSQQTIDCPLSVASNVTEPEPAIVEYTDAASGDLIVDDTTDCLAGRFDIKFASGQSQNGGQRGGHGEISGWFTLPWQQFM